MNHENLSDEELLYIVGQTDAELFHAGADIKCRYWEVPRVVMRRFGYIGYVISGVGKPKLLDRIEAAFASIYRKQDIAMGGHIGVFMYRDIFARIGVPHIYGRVSINPFDFVELTPVQLRIIQTEPDEMDAYLDQFADVADIQYGAQEVKKAYADIELVTRFIGLARLHLHSAAAVVTGGYDYRGAVQSSLLASELGLKAGAAAHGMSETEIKKQFNHRTDEVLDFVASHWSLMDYDRMKRAVSAQPEYVPNRYAATSQKEEKLGIW